MNLSKGIAVALPGDNDHLALAGLVNLAATVLAIRLAVGGLHVAAEVGSIDLDFTRQFRSGLFRRQSLTDLVREDEGRLVLAVQVAGELEGAMALCPVHEDCDSRENVAQVHLPAREERARRDRELRRASLALEDAAGLERVALKAAALRAHGVAVRGGPTDRPERVEGLVLRHAHHFRQGEGPGGGGEEEVLALGLHLSSHPMRTHWI